MSKVIARPFTCFPGADGSSRSDDLFEDLQIGTGFMASRQLLVLIARDVGLRSALIARLSLAGESLVTLIGDPGDPALDRIAPGPRILIVDLESLGDSLQLLLDHGSWAHIIILADRAERLSDRACMVDRRVALAAVGRELTRWRASLQG